MSSAESRVSMKNPLMIALDIEEAEKAIQLAQDLQPYAGAFKIGPRLAMRYGSELIAKVAAHAPVFVDNKYLDIPNTLLASVQATFETGASFCTVHAWAGEPALLRLSELEQELNRQRPFQVLVVTVLTSFSEESMPPTMAKEPIDVHVRRLAMLAQDCGLRGIVCSPFEVAALKQEWPQGFYVTPGVRLQGSQGKSPQAVAGEDQARVKTPFEAIRLGANALVVGRPIVEAAQPQEVCQQILDQIG